MTQAPEDRDLGRRRLEAAIASKGTSADVIHAMVLRLVEAEGLGGELLEFGAGTGALIRTLVRRGRFTRITGADILGRPEGLDPAISWIGMDLNDPLPLPGASFDTILSTEVIEHLENPRAVFREWFRLLRPGGTLVMTTPNQESVRSLCALLAGGHFASFLGMSYPAHITALLRLDITRICRETGFADPRFAYTDHGGLPKRPNTSWQSLSFNRLRGRLFSDNIGAVVRRPGPARG